MTFFSNPVFCQAVLAAFLGPAKGAQPVGFPAGLNTGLWCVYIVLSSTSGT